MSDERKFIAALSVACLLVLLGLWMGRARADDDPQAAFDAHGFAFFAMEYDTPDIPKLEAKAVAVLRTKRGLTLAEARAEVRVDGRTDVARCWEIVVRNALAGIVQGQISATAMAHQHPLTPLRSEVQP